MTTMFLFQKMQRKYIRQPKNWIKYYKHSYKHLKLVQFSYPSYYIVSNEIALCPSMELWEPRWKNLPTPTQRVRGHSAEWTAMSTTYTQENRHTRTVTSIPRTAPRAGAKHYTHRQTAAKDGPWTAALEVGKRCCPEQQNPAEEGSLQNVLSSKEIHPYVKRCRPLNVDYKSSRE